MHDMKDIRKNPDRYIAGLKAKNHDGGLSNLLDLDRERLELLESADTLKNERNVVSRGDSGTEA